MNDKYSSVYGALRRKMLAQNFAIGRYFRNNYIANEFKYEKVNLEIPSTRNRVLQLIKLTRLNHGSIENGYRCNLYPTVEETRRPTHTRFVDESTPEEWWLDVKYKMAHTSSATFELQEEIVGEPAEVIGSVTISANSLTATDVSLILEQGDSKYELHYRVFELFPAEVGLLDGGGDFDGIPTSPLEDIDDWHVEIHARENPLIASGLLLTCLAIEYYLGNADALKIIDSALNSIGSLYKFNGDHFNGYIIRWDAVTSDFWQEELTGGAAFPKRCLNFLTDANGKYLYCTPFNSPDYVTPDNYDGQPSRRWSYLHRYRYWEPSMDEINGLMMGYDAVYRFVNDPDILTKVRAQANNLGDYLAEHAYLLVRPGGGFACRGSAGPNPAMEFPFGEVFRRITGNSYPIPTNTNWEGAVTKAGIWDKIKNNVNALEVSILGAEVLAGGIVGAVTPFLTPTLGLIGLDLTDLNTITAISPFNLARAAAIYDNRGQFDVQHTLVNDPGERDSFVLAYILLQINPPSRTGLFLTGIKRGIGNWARKFPRYWGINALHLPNKNDNSNSALTSWYLDWNEAFYQNWHTGEFINPGWWANNRAGVILDSALAVLNGGGPLYQQRLVEMLNNTTQYAPSSGNDQVGDLDLEYMSAIAVSWLYVKLQQEQGVSVTYPDFPALPVFSEWPTPTIPIVPDTYVILWDTVNPTILGSYNDKKGRTVDFGVMPDSVRVGWGSILVAYPQDYSPRPLNFIQPNRNQDQLELSVIDNQAPVFFSDPSVPPVQKTTEPVIQAAQPLQYQMINPTVINGDFTPANLQVSIPSDTDVFSYNHPAIIGLTFIPEKAGPFNGTLTLSTNNPYIPSLTFTLTAQVAAPLMEAAPLDFGEVAKGASQMKNVLVKNVSQNTVYFSIENQPSDQTPYSPIDQFKLQSNLPYYCTIDPDHSIEIPVEFTARVEGLALAKLKFGFNYPGKMPVRHTSEVALKATAVFPEARMSIHALDFPTDQPMKIEQHRLLTITGETLCPVTVSLIKLQALDDLAFYIQQIPEQIYSPLPVTLQKNETISVDILFFPTNPGQTYHAKLQILSDDHLLPDQEVLISGGASGALARFIAPDRLNFGAVSLAAVRLANIMAIRDISPVKPIHVPGVTPGKVISTPTIKKLLLPNILVSIHSYGTSDLVLSDISFDPSIDVFSLSGLPSGFPIVLPTGSKLDFSVVFNPSKEGKYQSTLKIFSNHAYHTNFQTSVLGECKP